ncbi:Flp pilus assembly protein CpaB [Cohaesibacter celericrescens]|uniref:Flp pilus assembly protein CpaB n=1 Tax=Cohaesibacter celericrescens TaxID=2067669 RepID=A0A2N5XMQ6_9HYPH|nr:Flp pilus assembly protein CpaB [Cohaesibacter celericrescens]PLW75831.1 Flp pilus assembly protein CpaB [Cohaesibacter celericrescens]
MKVARIAVIAIALIAGLIALVLARSLGNGKDEAGPVETALDVPPQMELVEVLTAASYVSLGTSFTADLFAWQKWPADGTSPGYIVRGDRPDADSELVGAVARGSFMPGEPINEGKIAIAGKGLMSSILPKGFRAVATRISPETSAGGFVLPKDRVDVMLTQESDKGVSSETILTNIRVLAIDQSVEDKDGVKVVVGETATLELTPSQSEILVTAQQQGNLSLALRSLEDAEGDEVVDESTSGTIVMVRSGQMSKRTVKR